MSRIEIGKTVYHKDINNGHTPAEIVGVRRNEVELEHKLDVLVKTDWYSTDGILFEKPKEDLDIDIELINGHEIIAFIKEQLADNDDLCDVSLSCPEFVEQKIVDKTYVLKFNAYYNNWGTDQLLEDNEIRIKKGKVHVGLEEPCDGDGSDDAIEGILTEWLKTHKFSPLEDVKSAWGDMVQNCFEELGGIRYSDKADLEKIIEVLTLAKTMMK